MRRTALVLLAALYIASAAQALELNDLPPWLRSSLFPIYIDWQQWYRNFTHDLRPVENPIYGKAPTVPATTAPPLLVGTTDTALPRQASVNGLPQGLPRPVSGSRLSSIKEVSSTSPLAPVTATGASQSTLKSVSSSGVSQSTQPGMKPIYSSSPFAAITATGGGRAALNPVPSSGVSRCLQPGMKPAYSLLLTLKNEFAQGNLVEAKLPGWLAERNLDQNSLIQALDQMTLEHPMDEIYLPICKVLWDKIGPNTDEYLKFPYNARIIMGIYLGVLEREDDAKKLFASVPEEWQKEDPSVPMYHVANELLGVQHKSPRIAIWAWKWGAAMRGPSDQAFVCWHIMEACKTPQCRPLIETELIEYAEAALSRAGSEARWDFALFPLLWGYEQVGDTHAAVARGAYWIGQASGGAAGALEFSRLFLADVCVKLGKQDDAVKLLLPIARSAQRTSWQFSRAVGKLQQLVVSPKDMGCDPRDACAIRRWSPTDLVVSASPGQRVVRQVVFHGMPGFRLQQVGPARAITVEIHEPSVSEVLGWGIGDLRGMEATQVADVIVTMPNTPGPERHEVHFGTNDPAHPQLTVSLKAEPTYAIAIEPPTLFFGFVKPDTPERMVCTIRGTTPFAVKQIIVEKSKGIVPEIRRVGETEYSLTVTLCSHAAPGSTISGMLRVLTDLAAQEVIVVPYHAQVKQ